MKFIIASDSFKGSLSSEQANDIIEKKINKIFPGSVCNKIQIADGGEGTLKAIYGKDGNGYSKVEVDTLDPLGRKIKGIYLKKGEVAVVEMAESSGITLISDDEKNPLRTSSLGTGILIKHAILNGCKKMYIGIGGSSTNDAGIGAMQALGYKFLDSHNRELSGIGESLEKIVSIDDSEVLDNINEIEVIVMCDVNNPLTGKNGATYVYGPQKGGNKKSLDSLEKGMISYQKVLEEYSHKKIENVEGLGAAGGLGSALYAFMNGKMQSGINVLLELNNFENLLENTTVVITGEGKTDFQSACGKVIYGISSKCKERNIPVIVISGSLGENIEQLYDVGVSTMEAAVCDVMNIDKAIENATINLENAAERILRAIKIGMELK